MTDAAEHISVPEPVPSVPEQRSPVPEQRSPVPEPVEGLRAEALAWGRKPRRSGSLYVAEHMVRAMRAYGWTIIIGALGQPILYLLGLAVGLASLIRGELTDAWGGSVGYLTFVAPALLMTAGIQVASEEFSYPVMDGFKWRRFYYGFSASPIAPAQIASGVVIGASTRVLTAVGGYFLFLTLFQAVPHAGTGWLAIPVGILAALAFGMPLLAYAASITTDSGQFALVQRFVFMPMFLFSGTFYPLTALPIWLQWIGWISPLWHATELGRVVTYGSHEPVWLTVVHVAYLAVLALTGYLLARRRFERRLGE